MPSPPGCPECDIIILSYADVASEAGVIQWKAQAIDDLYGTDFVKARVKNNPALHQEVSNKLVAIIGRLRQDTTELQAIIKKLTDSSLADV